MKKLSARWMKSFNQLIQFKTMYNHSNVPRNVDEYKQLGLWVKNQRYEYCTGKMNPRKIELLENIGFVWDLHDAKWYEMLEDLKKFIAKNGHANVPQRVPEIKKLSIWVSTQRLNFKRGRMPKDRFLILENAGFDWAPHETKKKALERKSMFESQQAFFSQTSSSGEFPRIANHF